MIINEKVWGRLPTIINRSTQQFTNIMDFIRNDVKKTNVGETISASSLYGGENWDWCKLGLPIGDFYTARYNSYIARGLNEPSKKAVKQAGIDVGNCLQYLVEKSPYEFEVKHNFKGNEYTRVK